jgi:hypothetical protein
MKKTFYVSKFRNQNVDLYVYSTQVNLCENIFLNYFKISFRFDISKY